VDGGAPGGAAGPRGVRRHGVRGGGRGDHRVSHRLTDYSIADCVSHHLAEYCVSHRLTEYRVAGFVLTCVNVYDESTATNGNALQAALIAALGTLRAVLSVSALADVLVRDHKLKVTPSF
jgi:hypothetical protein